MILPNRRGFMKTLLLTAASALSGRLDFSQAIALPSLELETTAASTNLENGDQQLRFLPVGGPFAFQNFVRVSNQWKPATLSGIPVLSGPSFPLLTSRRGDQWSER
jgi:hypothetical protein